MGGHPMAGVSLHWAAEQCCCLFEFNIDFNKFSVISRCIWLRQGVQYLYSAVSLMYHAPDTWHDTTPSHIILTLGRPVLVLPRKSECQARGSYYHFNDFGMSRPGIKPMTSRSPERTLYLLSYRGQQSEFCSIFFLPINVLTTKRSRFTFQTFKNHFLRFLWLQFNIDWHKSTESI